MLIFLVGFMGSGKSTAGQMLANKCGYNFIDLDTEIALKCKKSIPEIFNTEGVDYFRNLETITLKELNPANKTIVATGGGCPCVNDNMNWMNENGVTIYIKAQHGTLFHRLLPNKKKQTLDILTL